MNLRIRTFSMALVAMSAASQVYALPSDESENKEKKEERNVMLNASDANKPREIQIGLPSEDVTVYENGLPAVYSSSVHRLSAHWRSDAFFCVVPTIWMCRDSIIFRSTVARAITGMRIRTVSSRVPS